MFIPVKGQRNTTDRKLLDNFDQFSFPVGGNTGQGNSVALPVVGGHRRFLKTFGDDQVVGILSFSFYPEYRKRGTAKTAVGEPTITVTTTLRPVFSELDSQHNTGVTKCREEQPVGRSGDGPPTPATRDYLQKGRMAAGDFFAKLLYYFSSDTPRLGITEGAAADNKFFRQSLRFQVGPVFSRQFTYPNDSLVNPIYSLGGSGLISCSVTDKGCSA